MPIRTNRYLTTQRDKVWKRPGRPLAMLKVRTRKCPDTTIYKITANGQTSFLMHPAMLVKLRKAIDQKRSNPECHE